MAPAKTADPAGGLNLELDFTGLSDRERPTHFTPADILFKIEALTPRIKKGDERKPTASQTRMIEMKVRAVRTSYGGDVAGVLYENLMTFIPGKEPREYLWKIRNLLKAVSDKDIPTSVMKVNLAGIMERTFMGTVTDGDDWERTNEETGKTTTYQTSQISAFHKAGLFEESYPVGSAPQQLSAKADVEADDDTDTSSPAAAADETSDEDDNTLPPLEVTDL